MEELCSKLSAQEVTEEMVADMVIADSGYPGGRKLLEVAVTMIKARRKIVDSKKFRENMLDHQDFLFDLIKESIEVWRILITT